MARIPPIRPDAVDGELAEFYGAITDLLGRVPNFYRTLSHAPFLAMLLLAFNASAQREWPGARLSGRLKELIVIKTSHVNGCDYCFAHNTSLGLAAGITQEQVIALSSGEYMASPLFDARERAALEWAEHVTRNTARAREDVWQRLRRHYSEAEAVEITILCAMFNMINRINDSLDVTLEEQPEIDRIQRSLRLDPRKVKAYLRWLADSWPEEFDTLNGEAASAAARPAEAAE